jgi:hypothetical protein
VAAVDHRIELGWLALPSAADKNKSPGTFRQSSSQAQRQAFACSVF